MFKISTKLSITISITLSIIFLVGCIIGAFVLPYMLNSFITTWSMTHGSMSMANTVFIFILAYIALFIVSCAGIMLFFLLLRVKKGMVFTDISVSLIRGVSWCCILLGVVFTLAGIYFQLGLIVSFAAIFLGICLRVTKNVIEEATLIKSENDLTV